MSEANGVLCVYYLRARYYDPATAQFMSRDPMVGLTRSPYAYVGGDPLNGTDPSGLCDWTDIPCQIAAAAAAVVQAENDTLRGAQRFADSSAGERSNAIIDRYSHGLTSSIEGHFGASYDHCSANWQDAHNSVAGTLAEGVGDYTIFRGASAGAAATIRGVPALGPAGSIFGRSYNGGSAVISSGWLRVGWGWDGSQQVFRVALGGFNKAFWRHIDLFR